MLAAGLLFTPGCWNRRDPEQLAIVLATAFDYHEEKEMFLVIAQIANSQAMQAESGSGSSGGSSISRRPFWVISAYGHNPFEAMRNLTLGTTREVVWTHSRIILFSEAAARHGLKEILDVSERERQTRVITRPVVVQGDIRRLMEADFPLEETGAIALDRQMVTILFNKSVFHTLHLNEMLNIIETPGVEVFLGKITVLEQQEESTSPGEAESGKASSGDQNPPPPAHTAGGAIFKGDRLAGWATPHQTEGWLLAMGRGHRFSFLSECPDQPGSYYSTEIYDAGAEMEPIIRGKELRIRIKVKGKARIQNYNCPGAFQSNSEFIDSLERRTAQAIRNRIQSMVKRAQDLKSDVMGFGNLFYRKYPRVWREIEEKWEQLFSILPVDIEVEIDIVRTGLYYEPLEIQQ